MNTQLNAMKQALEALEIAQNNLAPSRGSAREYGDGELWDKYDDAITALRARLEQPEQEPVTEVKENPYCPEGRSDEITEYLPIGTKLYTTPPYVATPLAALAPKDRRSAWVGLTDEEVEQGYETTGHYQTLRPQDRFAVFALARAIEAKLKAKNSP